jgi:hypothetical protein
MITPLDEPIPIGLAVFHYRVDIDGAVWERGDVFYISDHRGVPREYRFTHYNAATGEASCYSMSRYGPQGRTTAAGYVSMVPTRAVDPQMSGDNLALAALLGDLRDAGEDELADEIEAAWAEAPATVRARLLEKGQAALDATDPDETVEDDE